MGRGANGDARWHWQSVRGVALTAALAIVVTAVPNTAAAELPTDRPVRILPLGDSLTSGFGNGHIAYRGYLQDLLEAEGHDVDFVGFQPNVADGFGGPCSALPPQWTDCEHAGYSGYTTEVAADQGYVNAFYLEPDLALVHLGTNDIREEESVASTIDDLELAVSYLRQGKADGMNDRGANIDVADVELPILLAQIIPARGPEGADPGDQEFMEEIEQLNALIPALAASLSTTESPVTVVDHHAAVSEAMVDGGDGVHPNQAGFQAMAGAWFSALDPILTASPPGPGNEINIDPRHTVYSFGQARFYGSSATTAPNARIVGMAPTVSGLGYWEVAANGAVYDSGDARHLGDADSAALSRPVVGMAATPSGDGYWLVASDGGIFAYGDAGFFGSTGAVRLAKPIVGMAATPSGDGYWLVASDGGIFAYGDAGFLGSTGAVRLNKPVVGMAATPSGRGYWLVASDGGIFAYGDAGFFGSTGAITLNQPIVGMAADDGGRGYWFVARDGGVFSYGQGVPFLGSAAGRIPGRSIVGMAPLPTGSGYWMVAD